MNKRTKSPQPEAAPSHSNVFSEEAELLASIRMHMSKEDLAPEALRGLLDELASGYDKLLKTSMKLARISDIQGAMLITREQEVQTANDQLREAERQRRELISEISHELGTPLMAIQSYLKAVLDGMLEFDRKYAAMMYEKLMMMNRLIEDLFQLSTLRANQLAFNWQVTEVDELFSRLTAKYEMPAAQKRIALRVEPMPERLRAERRKVRADAVRVDQLLNNLVDNAIKYTPENGEIVIAFDAVEQDGREWLAVSVSDNGVGISEEDQPRIFHRQYRTESAQQAETGKGLGLAISREIAAKHDGMLNVRSRVGEGSVFTFHLPLQPNQ